MAFTFSFITSVGDAVGEFIIIPFDPKNGMGNLEVWVKEK